MKIKNLVFALALAGMIPAGAEIYNLNADWRYHEGCTDTCRMPAAKARIESDGAGVETFEFDDSRWQRVSLPHPVNAHDSFDGRAVDAGEGGFFRGTMWYRKRFTLERVVDGKYFLEFETVRQTIYVWVNGKFVGFYEAGIAPTCYDITDVVRPGENLITVETDNCAARGTKVISCETKPGSEPGMQDGNGYQWNSTDFNEVQGGLVGSVRLHVKPSKLYLTLPFYNNLKTVGTYVSAADFDYASGAATVTVIAEVRNESARAAKDAKIKVEIIGPADGKVVGSFTSAATAVPAAKDAGAKFLSSLESDVYAENAMPTRLVEPETVKIAACGKVSGLVFWSPDTPHLYDVRVSIVGGADNKPTTTSGDVETIRTGFRHVEYDAAKGGLLINGKNVWLTGYAQRATDEWAAIGVAPDWLQDYDAKLLRSSNANFVRWMHVAPKPAPMRAYDKYGIVNAVPAGDKEGDASGRTWAQRMEAMRDVMIYYRNSPSAFFWEGGNNQLTPAHLKEMREMKNVLDPGNGRFSGSRTISSVEQIKEAEYAGTMLHRHEDGAFQSMGKAKKFIPIMETEYARQESPRRCWDDFTGPDYDYVGAYLNGGKKETGYNVYDQTQEDFARTTAKEYADFYSRWSNGKGPRTYAACAALCWTDSNQHGRQSSSENCRVSGRVDAVRVPKMNYHVFKTMQSPVPAVKIVGHWNYEKKTADNYKYKETQFNGKYMAPTGNILQRDPEHKTVFVIGSPHIASVELLVNGKSQEKLERPEDLFIWAFGDIDVTESGRIEAIARDAKGSEIARDVIETAGTPAELVLKPHTGPKGWLADGSDIAVVDVKLVDANGRLYPIAENKVTFTLTFESSTESTNRRIDKSTNSSPLFMGGYNSGTFSKGDKLAGGPFGESPVGKDWVKLECGENRVFLKSGRSSGRAVLNAKSDNGMTAAIELVLTPVEVKGGMMAEDAQSDSPNQKTYIAKTDAPVVQNVLGAAKKSGGDKWKVTVEGKEVEFPNGWGAPVKPDDNTGVCAAFYPVLKALKDAGAEIEVSEDHKKIPSNKKWIRKICANPGKPYFPTVTLKAKGIDYDATVGFTVVFENNGRDKNLTNCEIYFAGKKDRGEVCGELSSMIGYVPGAEIKLDEKNKVMAITLKK